MRRANGDSGFTLVELLLVMLLIGITGTTTAMVTLQGARAYADLIVRKDRLYDARLTLERVAREVRAASSVGLASGRLDVTTTDRGTISIYRDATTGTIHVGSAVLADNITALTFSIENGSQPNWVEMNATDSAGVKYRTKVYRRKGIFYPS